MTTENQDPQNEAPPSLRDDLETAIAEVEKEFTPPEAKADETPSETPPPGKTPETPPEPEDTGEESPPAATSDERYADDAAKYPTLTAERIEKAPAGWRPGAREGWSDLPAHVRREIHRRELDIATGQQDTADARKLAGRFQETITPYHALIAAEGAKDPLEAVDGLLKTAATLAQGAPQVKAQRMAQLINHYGVDIELLDAQLTAQLKNEPPPAGDNGIDTVLDQKLKPVMDFMGQLQGQIQQAGEQSAATVKAEVDKFGENAEFLADVRLDMADLLDMAAARGRKMTLQEAYDTACQMNPDIRAVMASRQVGQETQRVETKVQRARTTPTGRQTAVTPPQSNGDLRGDIMTAIESLENH